MKNLSSLTIGQNVKIKAPRLAINFTANQFKLNPLLLEKLNISKADPSLGLGIYVKNKRLYLVRQPIKEGGWKISINEKGYGRFSSRPLISVLLENLVLAKNGASSITFELAEKQPEDGYLQCSQPRFNRPSKKLSHAKN